jgi:hypothetical protein
MDEKKLMKQVAECNMPDFLEVKKSCMEQLKESGKAQYKQARFPKVAAVTVIAMVVICLWVSPVHSLETNLVQHMKTMLNLKETNEADSLSSENSESSSSDLLYRTIDGPTISLEKGEEINLSVTNGKEYKDVTISLLGKDTTHKIGTLNENTPYTYAVDVSGEYVIYAGKNHKNITDEIVVEHVCDMTQSGTIEQKR